MFNSDILQIILIFIAAYLFLTAFMFISQKSYIYFPDNQDFESCSGFSDSEKVNENGTRMYYTDNNSDTLVVYYHGNAGSACDRYFIKDRFSENNISSIIVEYSGYSGDERSPSKSLILKDVENVGSFIDSTSYENVVFMGTSLGSSVAAYHTTIRESDKFIAISSFDKLSSIAKKHYPFLPINLLLQEEYETDVWLENFNGEALFLHGSEDTIIPVSYGRRVYEGLDIENKEFIEIEGESHNTIFSSERLWEEIFSFLEIQ